MPKLNSRKIFALGRESDSRLARKYHAWNKKRRTTAKASRRANAK
jgi:hypothetical protein